MDLATLQKYTDLGFRLHPLKPMAKTPLLQGWADLATRDLTVIEKWFATYPDANIGMVAGAGSNITVVDVDPRNGGDVTWAMLVAKHGEPIAPKVKTARGGFHYYFRHFFGSTKLGPGVDVLGNRHNVVLPPTVTEDGSYSWITEPDKIPGAPAWIKQLAKKQSGDRNDSAYRTACASFRSGMDEDAVLEAILTEFGDDTDALHNEGLRKTVHSARERVHAPRRAFISANGVDADDFDNYLPSDLGNAELFLKNVGDDLLFIRDVGWVTYDTTRWKFDEGLAYSKFTTVMNDQRLRYSEAANSAVDQNVEKELRSREHHYTLSTNNRTIQNGVELAQTLPGIAAEVAEFDNDSCANLLNFNNGTVDLTTGTLREHSREDKITKICTAAYVADAPAPFWDATINTMFGGDQELITYVQTMLGASLLGSQDTRTLFIAYGRTGKNGKSTLFETLAEILGDYADHAELRMLASTDTGNLTELTTRMRIRGARLVLSSEVTSSDSMDANMIKRLTGGDTISARSMFKATITFRPVCSIWLRTNALPVIRGADQPFWERICIIPFDHRFEGDEQLPMAVVMEKFKSEAEGILAWLVEGAVMWNNKTAAIVIPQRVQELREMYMSDTDTFADFVSEMLKYTAGVETKVGTLHRAYLDFCKQRGAPGPLMSGFKQELRNASMLSSDGRFVRNYIVNTDYGTFEM